MEYNRGKKVLALLVVLLIAVGLVYVLTGDGVIDPSSSQQTTEDNSPLKVSHTDLTKATSSAEKLPKGMPADIPVETENVTESYTAQHDGLNATQYTLTYMSDKSIEEKYSEYQSYMTAVGYEVGEGVNRPNLRTISGTKNNDDLSVVLSTQNGQTQVQLSYLDRK